MMEPRRLTPGQRCRIWTTSGEPDDLVLVWESDEVLLEAPNWAPDGSSLLLNGDGGLWRLDLARGTLAGVELEGVPDINNDHVLAPDGESIYLSAMDFHIYRAPVNGGRAVRVSGLPEEQVVVWPELPAMMHFLHGVSPDGERLAFTAMEPLRGEHFTAFNLFDMSSDGGDYRQLTFGDTAAWDGPEYSPDGQWLYVNTELFDGHAQIGRLRPDGSDPEQLTFDERVNWFPHWSPDGRRACYVSFGPGTLGHPSDVWVEVKVAENHQWHDAVTVARVFGGQGTMNVNSWSPDSSRFAFVDYTEV